MQPRSPLEEQIDLVSNLLTATCALNGGKIEFAREMVAKLLDQQTNKLVKMSELIADLHRAGL
ncbi:MAG TPA: hypothetical protein VGN34_19845 [Ktedonobacteraceae bacterium]|jgi:hypothetical protein